MKANVRRSSIAPFREAEKEMFWRAILFVHCFIALFGIISLGASKSTIDFLQPRRYELWGPDCWTIKEGKAIFQKAQGTAFIVATGLPPKELILEADIIISGREEGGYATAGLAVCVDPLNHWRLLLVAGPREEHYFELVEMLEGEHQAQGGLRSSSTRLPAISRGELQSWNYGQRYHLQLMLSSEAIVGRVTEAETNAIWERSYSLTRGVAVRQGRPALTCSAMQGVFEKLNVKAVHLSTAPPVALSKGPQGTIVIIPDAAQTIAPRLAQMLREQGYGVTILPWEQLAQPLPWDKLDVLILADARKVPVSARDRVLEASQCGGKMICLGAPAFQTLLGATPQGWQPRTHWQHAWAATLPRRPIAIAPQAWRRQSSHPELSSSVAPDPASGAAAWRFHSELKNWDTWRADVAYPFDEQYHGLLFEAKGDPETPQLSIECVEQDGSRWIAVVELSPDWQTFVLQPMDFSYWPDSPTPTRGGPGDRLQPQNVKAIVFGLAGSHTKKVRPGPHTYWIRNIAAAQASQIPSIDFSVPSLEILCPSYKIYPMNEIVELRAADAQQITKMRPVAWTKPAYAPVWRERGRGLHRKRAWRWLPILDAYDDSGRKRGSLVSLLIGDAIYPDAMWANVAVSDPAQAVQKELAPVLQDTIRAMIRGCFLLEGGAELFSYKPGEIAMIGGTAINLSRQPQLLTISCVLKDAGGRTVLDRRKTFRVAPRATAEACWPVKLTFTPPGAYIVETSLLMGNRLIDRISHRIEQIRTMPAKPEEFVRVEGSYFMLGRKRWHFKGVNYWANWIGGYPGLNVYQRSCYDPEIIERDLQQLQAIGVNALSAVQALVPPNPRDPLAFRDQLDFLERCHRHGLKVFFFLPFGRPYYGGSFEKIKEYITQAGLKDHPAIMCWELAWEPIDTPWQGRLNFMLKDWNRWIVQRYGSYENAFSDWQFKPPLTSEGFVPIPEVQQCQQHGPWDRYVAAFRRAHADLISAAYRDIAEPLRRWDPKHLISFRGGACGIPYGAHFAHIHSPGAAKHLDFLNPEGYNLQTNGIGTLTPPDDIRKGGLVTLFYRFLGREKPVVWMEFGYTVNGIHTEWQPELVHIKPEELQRQATELRNFYEMFLESGARGAAPWWWPGGFRLGENSDFGLVEPDGTLRPAGEIMQQYLPRFEHVQHLPPTDYILLDLDTHYPDSWPLYSQQYLELIKSGKRPYVRTAGTGTTSANCPLTAVGGTLYNGHNPPIFLNAEFNSLEIQIGEGQWQPVLEGQTIRVPVGVRVLCRASVGNLGEATWLAPKAGLNEGGVFLAGREEYGLPFIAPIAADTPYLADATIPAFVLISKVTPGKHTISCEMYSQGRAYFGERLVFVIEGI